VHDAVRAALREGLSDCQGPDGLAAPASTWIVSMVAPSA
jgi:hypothetical protein